MSARSPSSSGVLSPKTSSGPPSYTASYSNLSDSGSDSDEIIWSVSDVSVSAASGPRRWAEQQPSSPSESSEEDFIVLSRPRTPSSTQPLSLAVSIASDRPPPSSIDALSESFSQLTYSDLQSSQSSISDLKSNVAISEPSLRSPTTPTSSPKRRNRRRRAVAVQSTAGSTKAEHVSVSTPRPAEPSATAQKKPKKKKSKQKVEAPAGSPKRKAGGLGERPIVDDVSEAGDVTAAYEAATKYISTFLQNPSKQTSDLTFLQALIVELGLCPTQSHHSPKADDPFSSLPTLPRSLTSAKAMLKNRVFLNIRDYLAARNKGLDALRSVMHPSKQALIKDIRKGKGKRTVSRDWVKESGLGVLLVTCYR